MFIQVSNSVVINSDQILRFEDVGPGTGRTDLWQVDGVRIALGVDFTALCNALATSNQPPFITILPAAVALAAGRSTDG